MSKTIVTTLEKVIAKYVGLENSTNSVALEAIYNFGKELQKDSRVIKQTTLFTKVSEATGLPKWELERRLQFADSFPSFKAFVKTLDSSQPFPSWNDAYRTIVLESVVAEAGIPERNVSRKEDGTIASSKLSAPIPGLPSFAKYDFRIFSFSTSVLEGARVEKAADKAGMNLSTFASNAVLKEVNRILAKGS